MAEATTRKREIESILLDVISGNLRTKAQNFDERFEVRPKKSIKNSFDQGTFESALNSLRRRRISSIKIDSFPSNYKRKSFDVMSCLLCFMLCNVWWSVQLFPLPGIHPTHTVALAVFSIRNLPVASMMSRSFNLNGRFNITVITRRMFIMWKAFDEKEHRGKFAFLFSLLSSGVKWCGNSLENPLILIQYFVEGKKFFLSFARHLSRGSSSVICFSGSNLRINPSKMGIQLEGFEIHNWISVSAPS
jgi:hypothetical protein